MTLPGAESTSLVCVLETLSDLNRSTIKYSRAP